MFRSRVQQQRVTLADRYGLAVAARNALAVQHMKELVGCGMLVRWRGAPRPENLDYEDIVDRIRGLIEQHHEIIGVLWRNPERLGLCERSNAEWHATVPLTVFTSRAVERGVRPQSRQWIMADLLDELHQSAGGALHQLLTELGRRLGGIAARA